MHCGRDTVNARVSNDHDNDKICLNYFWDLGATCVFPNRYHIRPFANLMCAYWRPVGDSHKTSLLVERAAIRRNMTIISVLHLFTRLLEKLHIQLTAQSMRRPACFRGFGQREFEADQASTRCQ